MNHSYVQSLFGGADSGVTQELFFSLVTVMKASLGDQAMVSHVSVSIPAVVIVLSLNSTLGSLVAVISHGQ